MSPVTDIINELVNGHNTSDENLLQLICTEDELPQLTYAADKIPRDNYGTDVYIRGLIEFTNYCRNSCYYCGINARNKKVQRFRLYKQDILSFSLILLYLFYLLYLFAPLKIVYKLLCSHLPQSVTS